MYDSLAKEHVSRQTIRLVGAALEARGLAPADARLAGLGGRGIWVKDWLAQGYVADQAYLIERNRKRAADLMRDETLKGVRIVQSTLANFPRVFAAQVEDGTGIDVLNLDFNGTLESALKDVTKIMTLFACSRGKAMVLTVADARRNQSLDNPAKTAKHIQEFFAQGARLPRQELESAWRILCAEHDGLEVSHTFPEAADPLKAAFRELSTIVQLAEIAQAYELELDPEHGCRFIYSGDDAFRMRTYVFSFRKLNPATIGAGVLEYLRHPCFYVTQDTATPLTGSAEPATSPPQFSDIANERYTFMKAGTLKSGQDRKVGPSTPSASVASEVLSADDQDFVRRGLEFFDEELKTAFQDLLLAAKGGDVPPKQLRASKRRLRAASLHQRFRQIVSSLEQRIDFTLHRDAFLGEFAVGSLFRDFTATFQKLVDEEADRLCALAAKHDLTHQQLLDLLCAQYELAIIDGRVVSKPKAETQATNVPAAAPTLEQRLDSDMRDAKKRKNSGAPSVAAPKPSDSPAERVRVGDRRNMTESTIRKSAEKDQSLSIYLALMGKSAEERHQIATRMLGERYVRSPRVLHALLASWSTSKRFPTCIVYLAYVTTASEMQRRVERLIQAFGLATVTGYVDKCDKVRVWRERVNAEPKLVTWLSDALKTAT